MQHRNAIDYLANTLIFVVSGIIIAGKLYIGHQAGSPHVLTAFDYGWAVALWLLLLVSATLALLLNFVCFVSSQEGSLFGQQAAICHDVA